MKIIKSTPRPNGKVRLIVEVDPSEQLLAYNQDDQVLIIDRDAHYKLGYPMECVVSGNHLANTRQVEWCAVEQAWVR